MTDASHVDETTEKTGIGKVEVKCQEVPYR
jgi:hypothetical protein